PIYIDQTCDRVRSIPPAVATESMQHFFTAASSDAERCPTARFGIAARSATVLCRSVEQPLFGDEARARVRAIPVTLKTVHDFFNSRRADLEHRPQAMQTAVVRRSIKCAAKID